MALAEAMRGAAGRWVPRMWAGEGGRAAALASTALWPSERAYAGIVAARNAAYDRGWIESHQPAIPVVSVGNIGVGGAGKTPVAAWIASHLLADGRRPAIVLRGYARDEVLVHRELNPEVPVYADADRVAAVAAAAAEGRDVAVLDDGFQHRRLRRDLDLLLLPVEMMRFSPRLLPRGPWREPLAAAGRADLLALTYKSATPDEVGAAERRLSEVAAPRPILRCRISPSALVPLHGGARRPVEDLAGAEVLAVAALAWPEPFARNLRAAGAAVELAAFPDHHEFTSAEAAALLRRAAGRPVVVTLKDAVKLRPLVGEGAAVLVLLQSVDFEGGGAEIDTALRRAAAEGRR